MAYAPTVEVTTDLQHRWTELDNKRTSILQLCEEYASWTLPYLFPTAAAMTTTKDIELQNSKDSIGAQGVNHLSNKVVATLFPGQRLFFRLHVDAETKKLIAKAMQIQGDVSTVDAKANLERVIAEADTELLEVEKEAEEYMNMVAYRPVAVHAAKLLIVTGNALMYHPDNKPVQCYGLKNYCVVRDIAGQVIEIMTKECKAFSTFAPAVQEQLRALRPMRHPKQYKENDEVTIYTQIKLEDDGKFHVKQAGDHVTLNTEGAVWTKATLPWIPLTWNLVQGEDYGRGLVAEYAGAFHAVNVLNNSLLNIAAIMGDIKFLVNPASVLDVPEMNRAAPGTYHSGREGDITTPKVDKISDAQFIQSMIERYERQIAQAFLLNSQLTRNAERVTAEEIRRDANELEMSNGGIYSRMAAQWQLPTATIVLDQINFKGVGDGIEPSIITGMDSLSRSSEMDNMHMLLIDLGALNNVPEDIRVYIRKPEYIAFCGKNRQIDYQVFTKTETEVQEEMAKQQAMIMAQEKQKQDGAMQQTVAKEAVKDS